MQRARRFRFVGVALAVSLGGLIALSACSNYGGGERCELLSGNNGNDDCEDGLQCRVVTAAGYNSSPRCCPVNRAAATHPACIEAQDILDGGNTTPPAETGPAVEASTADAAEASTTAEAGPDADASDDGG
jgi:hypothetical protein